jgi:ABC-type transport system substrate-binding protein
MGSTPSLSAALPSRPLGALAAGSALVLSVVLSGSLLSGTVTAQEEAVGAGARPIDEFHPATRAGEPQPQPAFGGRVTLHLESMPENINRAVENSAVTRGIHHSLHESLVRQDWESWEYEPNVAQSWVTEDLVAIKPEFADRYQTQQVADGTAPLGLKVKVLIPMAERTSEDITQREVTAVFGRAEETEGDWRLTPVAKGNPLPEGGITVPKEHVLQVELGCVFTFSLRDDVLWHPTEGFDAHALDARDVQFSWDIFNNPNVDCDEIRFQFVKITRGDVVDERTVRFFYESQYFAALGSVGVDMMLLPSHLYDLTDPDNPLYDAAVAPGGDTYDPDEFSKLQGDWINDTEYNREKFVGLGPYRISKFTQQLIEGARFDGYFDKSRAGYFDEIRWRLVDNDDAAWVALINGELDFMYRVPSSYYTGEQTQKKVFTDTFYKGYFYTGSYGFVCWNLNRPALKDAAVRRALAMAFDGDEYLRTNYKGLAHRVTGPFPYNSSAYDHSVKPLPFDPEAAIFELEDAGWYDRNGNGIADKDGIELDLEFLMPSGNKASQTLGEKMQESFAEIGVRISIRELEWATFIERLQNRDFDGGNLAWMPDLESDPEQVWHSRWADKNSSNFSAYGNPAVDALIERGQRELDKKKRTAIWNEIHRLIYADMPYLFGYNVPRKFALKKEIRGFQSFAIRPGYAVRFWHYPAGHPGTRATLERQ